MGRVFIIYILLLLLYGASGCSGSANNPVEPDQEPSQPVGSIPEVIEPDIIIESQAEKISQLTGDYDREREEPTQNRTFLRYRLQATDLGVPFEDGERTWILFGDTWGDVGAARDAIAYTTDTDAEDGLDLEFISDENGVYLPINIPGITQAAFEVPTEGLMIDDQMYIYHTTDHSPPVTMGRSVLARASDIESAEFSYLYDFSTSKFINISIVKGVSPDWAHSAQLQERLPGNDEEALIIFGSGAYRESYVYLAHQPVSGIEDRHTVQYFAGLDEENEPLWSAAESNARPLFALDTPCVGEFSVSYNTFIDRWIMLYNCGNPRGINLRTSEHPWGPWTKPQIVFRPWEDGGYCHFIHTSWEFDQCDELHDAGREYEWGGEYGPYQFEHLATGDAQSTTIYFTLSTWNPYAVILMKARLKK